MKGRGRRDQEKKEIDGKIKDEREREGEDKKRD